MKATQIPITSGPAAGTMVTRVESNSGKLLGFIRVVAVAFPGIGCPSMFIAHQSGRHYGWKLCSALKDAYLFLGVSVKEQENSDIGEYAYDERIPHEYWKSHENG